METTIIGYIGTAKVPGRGGQGSGHQNPDFRV